MPNVESRSKSPAIKKTNSTKNTKSSTSNTSTNTTSQDTASASAKRRNDDVSPAKKIEELYSLVEGIDIAMMTCRSVDGTLVSRPMSTQEKRPRVDFWFVTSTETHKFDEIQAQPEVNLAYYNNKSREWVSVSGTARIVTDRDLIRTLYKPDWQAWFGDDGGQSQRWADGSTARTHRGRGARGDVPQVESAARRAAVQGREGAHHGQHAEDRRHATRRKEGAGSAAVVRPARVSGSAS